MSGYYDTAQVCTNGHVINRSANSCPERNQQFCDKCGSNTITSCQHCNATIRGSYHVPGVMALGFKPPAIASYCHNCGKPYPWTLQAIEAATELLEIEDILSKEELNYLSQNMGAIITDSPKTTVVATKLKLAIGKLSSNIGVALRDIFVDVASETAKKILFPQEP